MSSKNKSIIFSSIWRFYLAQLELANLHEQWTDLFDNLLAFLSYFHNSAVIETPIDKILWL